MNQVAIKITQRADLTFKQNKQHGRHGWLRLTPAYSVGLVDQILSEFGKNARRLLEPFSGTGTTPLCAAYKGLDVLSTDINPFLVWLGRVKTSNYQPSDREALLDIGESICTKLLLGKTSASLPPLKNIERWWSAPELEFVNTLKFEIDQIKEGKVKDLLRIAFCRTMMALSNAAFNHQSMSFKDETSKQATLLVDDKKTSFLRQFRDDLCVVESSCLDNPLTEARIEKADARKLASLHLEPNSFDLLITSPPYANRMSYIRELRPYMYWLGFLNEAKEAGELDWEAIGGTWGIATSRLLTWKPSDAFVPDYLFPILEKIRGSHPKNGELMAQYVQKYFDDMFQHFLSVAPLISSGGTTHYIIGNSTFYDHLVPADKIYEDQLNKAGFKNAVAKAIRKRNSKKELVEYHIVAER
jgi:D12 class N6 adenine-specific DNA methyltransferase